MEPQRPGHRRHGEVVGGDPAVGPALDRFQRGIDHRRAKDGHDGAGRGQQPEQRRDGAAEHPPGREEAGRHEGDDRGQPFARQPGGPPLRHRAPRSLRTAEVKRGGEEAAGDRRQRQPKGDEAECRGCRNQPERGQQAEQCQEAIAGARSAGEDDDGKGGMHGIAYRDRMRSIQWRKPPGSALMTGARAASAPVEPATFFGARGGRYLFTGL